MGANKNSNLQKCGEILIDVRRKNAKSKMYVFNCSFCNIQCDQLDKFSIHFEEVHINKSKCIKVEAELKFEAEPVEIRNQTFCNAENLTIKQEVEEYQNSCSINKVDLVSDDDTLNFDIKSEFLDDGGDICNVEIHSDNDSNDGHEFISNDDSVDKSFEFESDSENDIEWWDIDQTRVEKENKIKRKVYTNDINSAEYIDVDSSDNNIGDLSHKQSSSIKRQELRNSGKAYTTLTGKYISERKLRPLEDCKSKCKEKITKDQQQIIFNTYWQLGRHHLRQCYVANMIDVYGTRTQRKNKSLTNPRTRKHTYKYSLEVYGKKISVCQKCFRYTLCETEQFIRTTMKKKIEGTVKEGDRRGKHPNSRKINKETI